ncbi:Chaperone protein DnaK [Spironucleus salmonicida]|uniref:Chaperone protein DnaK n=1 Tax=Spironucleus salmonicida TaxID=348837 RepID=K7R1G9_9EUKA|nr:chaperone protein DnaK [Spironucleus salmonicida]KAH0570005.1 Chaperone protein DnaK [Spironucleus salmonicida]|eukprot:EST42536.1 Chaperone protein DnaK [Spironucleus salmonicida]
MYGIDLGTSNSCVATLKNQQTLMVKNALNQVITPSIIAYTQKGMLFGQEAKNQLMINPGNTIYSTKRLIGRRFEDFEVQNQIKEATYSIINQGNNPVIKTSLSPFLTPTTVASEFLQHLTKDLPSKDVVITVPAYFNNSQKEQTAKAAELANLKVIRLLAEPTAAALAYNAKNSSKKDEILLIVDLGAGTFDVSILEKSGDIYSVIASSGNNFFGGDDYTSKIFSDFTKNKILSPEQKADFFQISELCKHQLSSQNSFSHPLASMTRTHYESLIAGLDDQLKQPLLQAISDANINSSKISKILLVGGQTRQPSVQKYVEKLLGKRPLSILDPDLCVAQGAAIQGGIIAKTINSVLLVDVAPLSLGIETLGGSFAPIIPRNAPIPVRQTQVFTTTQNDQEEVVINVYQGERQLASQNHLLGSFALKNIKKGLKGSARVEVCFEVDKNGLVKVSAKDLETGSNQNIEITGGISGEIKEVSQEEKQRDREILDRETLKREIKELGGEFDDSESIVKLRQIVEKLKRRSKK